MSNLLFTLAVETSIRAALLVAAMALILTLFRIRSSGTRHAAWATVLAVMLLMPVLTRLAPQIRVSVPDRLGPLVPVPGPPLIGTPLPALPPSLTSGQRGATTSPVAPPVPALGNDAPVAPAAPVRWNEIGLVAYLAGLAFFLVRLVIGLGQLSRIRGRSQRVTPMPGEIAWESTLVATPATIGLLAPRVILPVAWREWTPEMLTAVLAHERAHATRRDPLIAVLARLNSAIFWFHPLAWWLERKLATLAEHACDDAAVKQVARRQYAETLLDIAATVRRHQGRLVWQGVGVDGDGRLGQRIDRVLSEAASPRLSRLRAVAAGMSCALAIVAVIACRQEQSVPPLREEPTLAAELKARSARSAEYRAAEQITLAEAASLEQTLEQNPEDTATREKLLVFYRWTGKNTQPWNDNVAARRRHVLWLVQHHPDSELMTSVRLSKREDLDGYIQARKLWMATIAPRDVDPKILSNAAYFFEESEKQMAEEILLRAKAQQPDGPLPRRANGIYYPAWSSRLGELYASAIAGKVGPYWRQEDPASQAWGRDKLERSTDGALLYTAGSHLVYWPASPEQRPFGRQLIERASQSDPPSEIAREWLRRAEPQNRLEEPLAENATGGRRLRQLASRAESQYMNGEYSDWRARQAPGTPEYSGNPQRDKEMAAAAFAGSKAAAREALDLAPSLTATPEYSNAVFRAHIASGLNALREGNRDEAVKQLLEASKVPAPSEPTPEPRAMLEYRLVNYLLKHGERATVIEYLERSAQGRERAQREKMLKEAAAVREGRMPEQYQWLLASGNL